MEYQVYLDVLFFWNFCLDCLILHQSELLFYAGQEKRKKRLLRKIAAAFVGAAGSVAITLFYRLPFFLKFILTIPGLSLLMVWIGFERGSGKMGKKLFFRQYLTFLGTTLLLGGLILFLQYRFHCNTFFAILSGGSLTEAGSRMYRYLKVRRSHLYDVCLCYGGRQIRIRGFYDTGNHLICPWNQKPVHVMDEAYLRKGSVETKELSEGFFYIPFSSVGKEEGILKATQADSLTVFREEGEILIEKPIVAFGASSLFEGRPYRMILHSCVMEN